jgi:microcin C transport system permease protein
LDARTAEQAPNSTAGPPAEPDEPKRRWFTLSPLNRRRWQNFKRNRRGYWSLWIFLALFLISLFAEFIANDKPFLIVMDGKLYFPAVVNYPETAFGGEFDPDREKGRHRHLADRPLLLRYPQS